MKRYKTLTAYCSLCFKRFLGNAEFERVWNPTGADVATSHDVDSDVEDLYAVPAPGTVVLVQTKSKYKWPGRVVGSDGTQLTVQLFDKHGLKGQQRSFEASAVEVFQWSNELNDFVEKTGNHELQNAYKKALKIVRGSD